MGSKFLLVSIRPRVEMTKMGPWKSIKIIEKRSSFPQKVTFRAASNLLPPSQYDTPFPKRLTPAVTFTKYWEVIPLFVVTMFGMGIMFYSIYWAINNKVDVALTTHNSRDNISHTMDLEQPTVHKIFTIDQKYVPWPEMAAILKKLNNIEYKKKKSESEC